MKKKNSKMINISNPKLITGFLIAVLFLFSGNVFSQVDKNGGSIYSLFGLGDLSYSSSNRTDAMGIMGFALYGDYTNSNNPAAWTRIQNTLFTSKFNLENIRSSDGNSKATRTYGNFEGFDLSIPFNKGNGWIFNFGINNYSNVNYDTYFTGTADGENYTQTYSGNGGLNKFNIGFSYILFRYLSFGAQFNYAFGNINKSVNIDFSNVNLFDTKNTSANTISGFFFNSGLIFHGFGKLFNNKKLDNMTLGVYLSTPTEFNSSLIGKFGRSTTTTDSISLSEGKLKIPLAFGVGIANTFNNKLTVSADMYYQKWDDYTYYGTHPAEIKNSMKIGAGIEYTASKKLEDPYLSRISYRLGGSYTQDYLKLNGQDINILSVSAGLSLPIGNYNSLDLYAKYNIRGKETNGLIKDEVFRFGASVRIGEFWFLRPSDEF
ncbi:MAG TPA: hypothetical protein VG961_14205 [Ignavibacteria bacterium]|nr:hypothetical protein [Ignavibacteria bacterium]